jgi:hypothetical protein
MKYSAIVSAAAERLSREVFWPGAVAVGSRRIFVTAAFPTVRWSASTAAGVRAAGVSAGAATGAAAGAGAGGSTRGSEARASPTSCVTRAFSFKPEWFR